MTDRLSVLRYGRRLLYLGLVASVALHLVVGAVWLLPKDEEEERVVARFEFQEQDTPLFVPAPRLAREFAFRKQPIPQGTPIVRSSGDETSTTVGGAVGRVRTAPTSATWTRTGGSADFLVDVGAGDLSAAVVGLPRFEAVELTSLKEPERRIDMEAEFLDLTALNTGRYRGMVIQDPTDKQNITGFVYLALAWGSILEPSQKRSINQLVRAINNYTRIEAQEYDQMFLDSQALFKAPFVYIAANRAFELTEHEAKNLARYLRSGGFVVADNGRPDLEFGPAEASLRQMFREALGRDARFVPLQNDHPIYHIFFDFDDGPPPGGEVSNRTYRRTVYFLEGIYLGDRLVAVYSDKGYGIFWERETQNEPHLKMGVNMVVFALTQKGSIAQQQIDFYNQHSQ
ncbi:MAG: DUF4159 domain-containing protein [Gemmatimonadaceae bacterium]|nr:DUF4159 domain-containing protein [Gemmatimonadaceae bacterium]